MTVQVYCGNLGNNSVSERIKMLNDLHKTGIEAVIIEPDGVCWSATAYPDGGFGGEVILSFRTFRLFSPKSEEVAESIKAHKLVLYSDSQQFKELVPYYQALGLSFVELQ